ncbi:MAG: Rpn family recombination-promoting nuclease/putative transposase [Spirochaetales bacterium]|nr:Rpn family recombination-promoting nuclease/putative transposase [Spirochaetales bacterium]
MNGKTDYVKATSDIFIKYLFGMDTKESNHLVLSFINSVLQDSDFPTITKVIQKNPFNYKEFTDDKLSVLDIEVEDENHKLYNIEVQSSGNTHFRNRALYYWAKLYTSQSREGDIYDTLLPTIGINILDFTLLPELPKYHNFFMITEGREKEYALTNHLIIHFLEIPKIKDKETSSKMAAWLLYLKVEGQDKKMLKILLENDEDLRAAHEMYKAFNSNDKLRRYALSREKAENDRQHFLYMAKKQGLQEGREEGELVDKHNVLIRQLELKCSLSEDERKHILSVTDFNKLNAALDAVVLARDKESVLRLL